MQSYGMCLYNILKLHEEQNQEFLMLPDSKELREAVKVLNQAVDLAQKKIEKDYFDHFIACQASKLNSGVSLKDVLEETANYYKDKK